MAKELAETSTIPNLFVLFFIINVKIKLFDKIGFIKKYMLRKNIRLKIDKD